MEDLTDEVRTFITAETKFEKARKPKPRRHRAPAYLAVLEDHMPLAESEPTSPGPGFPEPGSAGGNNAKPGGANAKLRGGTYLLPRSKWANSEQLANVWRHVYQDDYDHLSAMLKEDPDLVHARTEDGRGPLFWAHEYGRPLMIALLETAGANPRAVDAQGKTPNTASSEQVLLKH